MARPKKYTKKSLKAAVERYFASISRTVTATERVDSGKKDKDGHIVWENRPIFNDAGEEIRYVEYVRPPTVAGLCEYLGISRQTWATYCSEEEDNPFLDTTTRAQGRRRAYLEEQLLCRSGKDVRGVMFDLQNNCGYTERMEVSSREPRVVIIDDLADTVDTAETGGGEDE